MSIPLFCFLFLCRDPAVWSDPEKFDPSRFLERDDLPDPYTHIPFITGTHKCLGHQFAKMQMKLILSILMREFTFDLLPDLTFKRKMGITLYPSPPVRLSVSAVA